jgi:hypothetical protein
VLTISNKVSQHAIYSRFFNNTAFFLKNPVLMPGFYNILIIQDKTILFVRNAAFYVFNHKLIIIKIAFFFDKRFKE